jgi:hypothetical protein
MGTVFIVITDADVNLFIVSRLFVSNVKSPSISSVKFVSPRNKLPPMVAFPDVVNVPQLKPPVMVALLFIFTSALYIIGCSLHL